MAQWKKIIVSGSNALLNTLSVSNGASGSFSGSFFGDGAGLKGIPAGNKGAQGAQGVQGTQGDTGQKGITGATGAEGNNAGIRYNFDDDTDNSDPGTGNLDSIMQRLLQQLQFT